MSTKRSKLSIRGNSRNKLAKGLSLLLAFVFVLLMSTSIRAANLTHRVRPGESWWSISQQYGVSYSNLAQTNGRTPAHHVFSGETLIIPGTISTPSPTPKPPAPTQPQNPPAASGRHTVVRGETWWSIGMKYGINYFNLAQANGKTPQSIIYIGQILNIPGQATPAAPTPNPTTPPTKVPAPTRTPQAPSTNAKHTVAKGESWWSISIKYGVSYQVLAQTNGRQPSHFVYVGEILIIPGQGSVAPTPTPKPTAVPTASPTAAPTATPLPNPTAVPTAVPTIAPAPALQVIALDSVSDPRMSSEANTYKIIMAPNTYNIGNDSGLGLGMMIKTPNNKTIMIDGGLQQMLDNSAALVSGAGTGELANIKTWLATHANNQVDTWILTHPHNDHSRVPAAVMHEGQVSIGRVYGVEYPKALHDERVGDESALQSAFVFDAYNLMKTQGKYTEISSGLSVSIDGVNIEFLNAYNAGLWRQNDSSAVMRLTFDGSDKVLLLLVDIQEAGAELLMQRFPGKLKADVVQMAHHGMDPLTSLYNQIAPSINLIPAGGALISRAAIIENSNYIANSLGATNYFANGKWHVVEIKR